MGLLVDPRRDPFSEEWERREGAAEMEGDTIAWVSSNVAMAPPSMLKNMMKGAIRSAVERRIERLLPGYRVTCTLKEGPIDRTALNVLGVRSPEHAIAAGVYGWRAQKENHGDVH